MGKKIRHMGKWMQMFDETKDIACLEHAMEEIMEVETNMETATEKSKCWCQLLYTTDKVIKETVEETEPPSLNVAPPRGTHSAGVDPAVISDSAERKEYELAITKNRHKISEANFQNALKRFREHVILLIEHYMDELTADAREEFRQILISYNLDIELFRRYNF